MGVMLSLDRPGLARSRRPGRHARRPDDQAWADAVAAMLTGEAPNTGGCVVRLAKTMLAGLLLPADAAIAGQPLTDGTQAHGDPLTDGAQAQGDPRDAPLRRAAPPGAELSAACLLDQCHDSPAGPGCASPACTHDCHDRVPVAARSGAPAA
jgi:hypothetical protein